MWCQGGAWWAVGRLCGNKTAAASIAHTHLHVCVHPCALLLLSRGRVCSQIATRRLVVYLNNCLPPGSWAERLFLPLQPPALPCMWSKCCLWGTPQPTQHLGKVLQLGASCQPLPPYFCVGSFIHDPADCCPIPKSLGAREHSSHSTLLQFQRMPGRREKAQKIKSASMRGLRVKSVD